MKKYLVIFLLMIFFSCNKDKGTLEITDFSKPDSITVRPYKYMPYAMFNIRIKGFTNDSIIIKTKGIYNLEFKLNGAFDTLWYSDYYGEGSIKCIFNPYKATKGNLEIELNL